MCMKTIKLFRHCIMVISTTTTTATTKKPEEQISFGCMFLEEKMLIGSNYSCKKAVS